MRTAIILALAAFVLAACGEDTEAQLSTCKADVLKAHDVLVDRILSSMGTKRVKGMDGLGKAIIEAHLATLKGREGLARCRQVLANGVANGA